MTRRRDSNDYYQWRPNWFHNSKKHQKDFEDFLVRNSAEIYSNLEFNEVFKFKYGKAVGTVWKTGLCCPTFREWLNLYKESLNVN